VIGTAVVWLIALYTEHGARLLIWNTMFGMMGQAQWMGQHHDPAFA
jgi:hypothetical protein